MTSTAQILHPLLGASEQDRPQSRLKTSVSTLNPDLGHSRRPRLRSKTSAQVEDLGPASKYLLQVPTCSVTVRETQVQGVTKKISEEFYPRLSNVLKEVVAESKRKIRFVSEELEIVKIMEDADVKVSDGVPCCCERVP
ncbi:hypothetical protein VNO78_34791 [Psophocarpus tetragonolobus]|uniref:Uncharacterized protein n=1 Tax=Psophocarpus tetragonolobus TaxID=3891 RepID=A0AAN9RHB4_PSOTE